MIFNGNECSVVISIMTFRLLLESEYLCRSSLVCFLFFVMVKMSVQEKHPFYCIVLRIFFF